MTSVVRHPGQGGFTLIEMLAALAIISMVMVPVTGWALSSMKEQSEVEDRSTTSSAAGLLRSYLVPDVASATAVSLNPATSACGTSGTNQVEFVSGSGATAAIVAYSLDVFEDLDGSVDTTRQSLWRRSCIGGGSVTDEVQIIEDVATSTVGATCDPDPATCDLVRIDATRADDPNHPIVQTATRRVLP